MNSPSKILSIPEVKHIYSKYANPYQQIKQDIIAIRKENAKMVRIGQKDEELGDYYNQLNTQLIQCCQDYQNLEGSAKVGMAKHIGELIKAIAKCRGIDPEKIDPLPASILIDNSKSNTGGTTFELPEISDESIAKLGDLIAIERTASTVSDRTSKRDSREE